MERKELSDSGEELEPCPPTDKEVKAAVKRFENALIAGIKASRQEYVTPTSVRDLKYCD